MGGHCNLARLPAMERDGFKLAIPATAKRAERAGTRKSKENRGQTTFILSANLAE